MLPDGTVERPIGGGGTEVDPWVEPFLRRCVNAAVRVGSTRHANLLSDVAGNSSLPDGIRLDAMEGLSEWSAPDPRDRVIGNWRPVGVEDRDLEGWRTILASRLPGLVEEGTGRIRQMALELSSRESIPLDGEINFTILGDSEATSGERIAALRQIARDGSERLDDSIENALASSDPRLRSEARDLLMRRSPERGIAALVDAIEGGTVQERQDAIRSLGESGDPGADGHVAALLELMPDRIDPDLRLDVLLAGRDVERPATATILERIERDVSTLPHGYLSLALSGGDPVAGASIVREHPGAQCLRCHRVSGLGGEAGPSLDGVAKRLSAEHLLQSIVEPSAVIVEGYGDASAMPAMHGILDVEQIRDVVAFLRTLENDDSDRGH